MQVCLPKHIYKLDNNLLTSVPDPDPNPDPDPHVLGLPDPDPLVRSMDPGTDPAPDPSIIMQK